jgi:hypothetical protein
LSPSADLPPEAALGTSPITQAEKDAFDAGTSIWALHEFVLRSGMDAADMAAEARKGWTARQAELLVKYNALASTWEYTGTRITP